MPSDSYSGYVDVTDSKSLHYVFVTSQNDPTTDPVLVWLNGGPGCSSMIGLFVEHGPMMVTETTEAHFIPNPHSWNKNSSVLYIESPATVGYSVGNASTDNITNDMIQS